MNVQWLGFFVLSALLWKDGLGQQVGDTVCAEGFIMDDYCLFRNNGRLLDTGDMTLENPGAHTLHCLVDVGVCNAGPYYILGDPETSGQLYSVEYVLDDAGHLTLLEMARNSGMKGGGCSTCLAESDGLRRGYRAEVIGTIESLDSPMRLKLVSAQTSNGLTQVCSGFENETTPPTAMPITAPTMQPVVAPTMMPAVGPSTAAPVMVPTTGAPLIIQTITPGFGPAIALRTKGPTIASPVMMPTTGAPLQTITPGFGPTIALRTKGPTIESTEAPQQTPTTTAPSPAISNSTQEPSIQIVAPTVNPTTSPSANDTTFNLTSTTPPSLAPTIFNSTVPGDAILGRNATSSTGRVTAAVLSTGVAATALALVVY